jgi:hypothetical protein
MSRCFSVAAAALVALVALAGCGSSKPGPVQSPAAPPAAVTVSPSVTAAASPPASAPPGTPAVAHGPATFAARRELAARPGLLPEPLAETTGLWTLPPGRPVPVTVGELSTLVDWFTAHAAWCAYGTSSGLDHSGWTGIIEANEQVTFAPLSCDRCPPAGHPLPDLPPHRGVPARQPQRGPDRALPPGPSRSARRPFPVALRRLPALGTAASADCPRTPCRNWAGERQRSRSVATLRKGPHIEPPNLCWNGRFGPLRSRRAERDLLSCYLGRVRGEVRRTALLRCSGRFGGRCSHSGRPQARGQKIA